MANSTAANSATAPPLVPLSTDRGRPIPLGVSREADKSQSTNFAVFADDRVNLLLYSNGDTQPRKVSLHQTGNVWHVALTGLPDDFQYAFQREGSETLLLDPYCRATAGAEVWGELPSTSTWPAPWQRMRERRSRYVADAYDWQDDRSVRISMQDSIIYELHVRGFTANENSNVAAPGTYRGLIEKIPHLKSLGITTVELLPIAEFEENDNPRSNPDADEPLMNFWGYHPLVYFAPKASYAANAGQEITEFRDMVKALHAAGMEVILDVVYNHTGECDVECPTYSFRELADDTYYAKNPDGTYRNDTGCGNTLNTNHPLVQDLIIDSLRYWVTEMHVDGFRFDLAAIFSRGQSGEVLDRPPIVDRITLDPVLADIKLIAEPWDAAGLYQVGKFSQDSRWSEWNDHFRDNIRRFVKSDPGMVPALASGLVGTPVAYPQTTGSVNFVACHDGFTLADVVAYNDKWNMANGEHRRDGSNANHSWNCGVEGVTESPDILKLRTQQIKNLATLLFMSQGVPMLLAGDEFGRTQHGNNNGYCLDNETTWLDWNLAQQNASLLRFFRKLIVFRQQYLPRWSTEETTGTHVRWHGCDSNQPDFDKHSRSLAMQVLSSGQGAEVFLIANSYWEDLNFKLPPATNGLPWRKIIDTAAESPQDIVALGDAQIWSEFSLNAIARSTIVLCAADV